MFIMRTIPLFVASLLLIHTLVATAPSLPNGFLSLASASSGGQLKPFVQLCKDTDPGSQEGKTFAAIIQQVLDLESSGPSNHANQCEKAASFLARKNSLDLSRQGLTTISPLVTLQFLKFVNLSFNHLENVAVLGEMPFLQRLDLDGNPVKDLPALMERSRARIHFSDAEEPYLQRTYQTLSH